MSVYVLYRTCKTVYHGDSRDESDWSETQIGYKMIDRDEGAQDNEWAEYCVSMYEGQGDYGFDVKAMAVFGEALFGEIDREVWNGISDSEMDMAREAMNRFTIEREKAKFLEAL